MLTAATAAADNAAWCDRVCRAHGLSPSYAAGAWASPRRTPAYYPDAVTLQPGISTADLLKRVDAGPGCSVKDSFADLDLASHDFDLLFSASWLSHDTVEPAAGRWSRIDDPAGLAAWTAAHGSADALVPSLLHDPAVALLVREGVSAGAVASRSGAVVGLSNVFAAGVDVAQVWRELPGAVAASFPGLPLVGYEHGEDLAHARAAGFTVLGALSVWLRPERPAGRTAP